VNATLTSIDVYSNHIGDEGASALADALKVNKSVMAIYLGDNGIGAEGASALADALKVNTSFTKIFLGNNAIGREGAAALIDALQVNTSLTRVHTYGNLILLSTRSSIDALVARNKRFRSLFLFDARRLLLSVRCADECGVVWPFLLESGDTDGIVAPGNLETIHAEFEVDVVAERERRR
jgi:hypothetical protein